MVNYLKIAIFQVLFSQSFSQWRFPKMEIIPAIPTSYDNVAIRIFGNTPSKSHLIKLINLLIGG